MIPKIFLLVMDHCKVEINHGIVSTLLLMLYYAPGQQKMKVPLSICAAGSSYGMALPATAAGFDPRLAVLALRHHSGADNPSLIIG